MIEAHELTKRYGDKTAVDGMGFTIARGPVTGFLGTNGAQRWYALPATAATCHCVQRSQLLRPATTPTSRSALAQLRRHLR